jgi:cell division septation protein DedD
MTLFPAEERPPAHAADFGTLPPEAEIAPVGPPPIAEAVPEGVPSGTSEFSRLPPPLETTAFGRASFDDPVFSVPVITSLEPGKYYLQLGAFGMIELAEAELARIGKKYPLAVQSDGNPYAPIYRILLGPVGLGESGALMQHFKSVGYNDAFVRQGL